MRSDSPCIGPGSGGPQPREMYRVTTDTMSKRDAHQDAYRPAVVIDAHPDVGIVAVCTRTTQQEDGSGVEHPSSAELDLNKRGWFRQRWYQSVQLSQFIAPLACRLGLLDQPTFDAVLEEVQR